MNCPIQWSGAATVLEELDQRGNLCSQCREDRILSAERAYVFDPASPARYLGLESPEAMASFALLQWIQLDRIFIKMKQFVLLKLTESFLISIEGQLEDPQFHLQKRRFFGLI